MKHFAELEGLRGWLSCWVVTAHILSRSGYHPETLPFPLALIRQGTPAVLVFIILSGFVITHLLMNSKQSYAPFLFRRFMRLYPVFLVTLLAAMSLHWMQIDVLKAVAPYSTAERATGLIEQYRSTEDHFFAHMAAHLPMLHGLVDQRLLPNSAYAFLGTAWSISLEWQFYLIAPLVVLALMRQPVITIVSLAAAGYLLRHRLVLNEAFLINAIVYFAVGIGWAHYVNRPSRTNAVLAVSMTAFVFVIGSQVAILIWAAVMALILRPVPPLNRLLTQPSIQWLGKVSYSTYLWHIITLAVAQWCLFQVVTPPSQASLLIATTFLTVPLTLVVSDLSYRFIEKPGIAIGKSATRAPAAQT